MTDTARNTDTMPDSFFRDLDPGEVESFKQWARDNHSPGNEINGCWHPIIRAECERIDRTAPPAPYLHNHKW